MPLSLIATPIGNTGDITQRAIETLRDADLVIGEERKEVSKLLKSLGIEGKQIELLNEHSKDDDVRELAALCETKKVALVTDCGTPGFCDPGARLVAACRAKKIPSSPIPGASSLMCLLSVSGRDLKEFVFRGFLPAEREERGRALNELGREPRPIILMDTPYRLTRLLDELAKKWPDRRALLGCDFTQPTETVIEAELKDLPELVGDRKAEFILAVFPRVGAIEHGPRPSQRESRSSTGQGTRSSEIRSRGDAKKLGGPRQGDARGKIGGNRPPKRRR